jgi:hypothetical protein
MIEQIKPGGLYRKVTKSDSVDMRVAHGQPDHPRALFVGTPGTLNAIDLSDTAVANFPIQAGLNPLRFKRITTSGDADDIWAIY